MVALSSRDVSASGRFLTLEPNEDDRLKEENMLDVEVPKLAVRITHPGYRTILSVARPVRTRGYGTVAQPREVYLFPGSKLILRVQDAMGRAVAGARVRAWAGLPTLSTVEPEWRMDTLRSWEDGSGHGVVLGEALSDAAGQVVFDAGPRELPWFACATTEGQCGFVHRERTWKAADIEAVLTMHGTVRITGRVTDASGAPVARARVACAPWYIAKRMKAGGRIPTPPDEVARCFRTMTDATGAYEISGLPVAADAGEMHVQAHRGDLGHGSAVLSAAGTSGAAIELDLVIESKYPVQPVRVLDVEGRPVAGALVTFGNMLPGMLTDAAGEAGLLRYPQAPGFPVELRAFKQGYRIASTPVPEEGETATLTLDVGTRLRGRVLDAEGLPVSAYVDIYAPSWAEKPLKERNALFGPAWFGRARAGEAGWFELRDLPPGPYFARYWFPTRREGKHHTVLGETMIEGPGPVELTLPESEPAHEATGIIEGSAVDAENNLVVPDWLSLKIPGRTVQPTLKGRRFRFEDVPAGTWTLKASGRQGTVKTEVAVVVRPAETTQVRVILGRSLTLRGRLLNAAGKALAGVYLIVDRAAEGSHAGSCTTDAAGRFELKNQLPGRYRIRIRQTGDDIAWCIPKTPVELGRDASGEVELRARPAGALILALEDKRFLPYTKDWHRQNRNPQYERSWFSRVKVTTASGEVLTDVGLFDGRKRFPFPLAPGNYDLRVEPWKGEVVRASFAITAGNETILSIKLDE